MNLLRKHRGDKLKQKGLVLKLILLVSIIADTPVAYADCI